MQIVEFTAGSLRFAEGVPAQAPADGFVWVYLDRAEYLTRAVELQGIAQRLGGSPLLDVHVKDLASDVHPSGYDATSVYDLIIFRRLATASEVRPLLLCRERKTESNSFFFMVCSPPLPWEHPASAAKS